MNQFKFKFKPERDAKGNAVFDPHRPWCCCWSAAGFCGRPARFLWCNLARPSLQVGGGVMALCNQHNWKAGYDQWRRVTADELDVLLVHEV
jgi:hypothetical protein